MGGVIACEAAQQLQATGEEVPILAVSPETAFNKGAGEPTQVISVTSCLLSFLTVFL